MYKKIAFTQLQKLIDSYILVIREKKIHKFSEADVGSKYILPFFKILGWDVTNIDEVKEQKRTITGPVDYSFNIDKECKFVVEIKKFSENLDSSRIVRGKKETFPEQAIRYAWHLKVDWVILTNFEELRLYYSHVRRPVDGLIFKLNYKEYLNNFDKVWILSKESVVSGIIDTYEKKRMRKDIDQEIIKDLLRCRRILVESIKKNNKIDENSIKESVQRILDRIIVIRVSEDRGIIGYDSLWKQLDSWKTRGLPTPFMRSLKSLFRDFDDVYNSKLFEEHYCEDLKIENKDLEEVILTLYQYNFELISADILGAIYEDYLGHILRDDDGGINIVKDNMKKKKTGIYYTPAHIVSYIVERALENIDRFSPDQISLLKILDPACGSGSFLIKAFDILKSFYDDYNDKQVRNKKGVDLVDFSQMISSIKKKIVTENLFGVDLDSQAVQIASVNVMLKALEKGQRLPLILGSNIKQGNSLIFGDRQELIKFFGDELELEKPFIWKEEFKQILQMEGFDIIIGNPPYGAKLTKKERRFFKNKYKVSKGYINTASLFIELSVSLMKNEGIMGFVVPKSLTFSQKWGVVREFILNNLQLVEIVDISKAFSNVLLEQIILICKKSIKRTDHYRSARFYLKKKMRYNEIPISLCRELDIFPIYIDKKAQLIYQKIKRKSIRLKEITKTFRGLPVQSKTFRDEGEDKVPILRGEDIRPYFNRNPKTFIEKRDLKAYTEKIKDLQRPKIISQRIIAHVLEPTDHIILMSTFDKTGLLSVDTVENTILTSSEYDIKYILAFLNSKVVLWFSYTFIFNKAIRTMDFDNYYVGKIPIYQIDKKDQKVLVELVDKIMVIMKEISTITIDFNFYLNQYPREKDKTLKEYFYKIPIEDRQIFIHSDIEGKIKHINVLEEDDSLSINVDYIDKKGDLFRETPIMNFKIEDKTFKSFIFYILKSNKKSLGKGNIINNILKIKIPCFNKNEKRNIEVIRKVIEDFLPRKDRYNFLLKEILTIENKINQLIYNIYDLNQDEITYIESETCKGSIIQRFLSPDYIT
ncbi:MAG: Eco57I restriction-modification methylase domain-containing protein [Promethearchaeota archaeon]